MRASICSTRDARRRVTAARAGQAPPPPLRAPLRVTRSESSARGGAGRLGSTWAGGGPRPRPKAARRAEASPIRKQADSNPPKARGPESARIRSEVSAAARPLLLRTSPRPLRPSRGGRCGREGRERERGAGGERETPLPSVASPPPANPLDSRSKKDAPLAREAARIRCRHGRFCNNSGGGEGWWGGGVESLIRVTGNRVGGGRNDGARDA
jgi:hypothetical protein